MLESQTPSSSTRGGHDVGHVYIQSQVRAGRLLVINKSLNVDHETEVVFVHNPKCMGTSLKKWLGIRIDNADHRYPTMMVNRATWENYRTIVVVRHPMDRFVSSYNFHCRSPYNGGYLKVFPRPEVLVYGAILPHDDKQAVLRGRTPVAVHAPPRDGHTRGPPRTLRGPREEELESRCR